MDTEIDIKCYLSIKFETVRTLKPKYSCIIHIMNVVNILFNNKVINECVLNY